MARIALYGGAFDPPHAAHLFTMTYLQSRQDVDEVWVIPCGNHVFNKAMQPFEVRVSLLENVLQEQGWSGVSISTIEGETSESSRTFDTLTALTEKHPEHEFVWVIGADNLSESHRWYRFDDIVARWPMIVLGRPGHEESLRRRSEATWCRPGPMMPMVSSTEIRRAIAVGLDDAVLQWLPESIGDTCRALYGSTELDAPLHIQVFGYGRVGQAFTAALRGRGHRVSTWNRSPCEGVDAVGELPEKPATDVWLLTINDDALPELSERLLAQYGAGEKTAVLHCAGRLGAEALHELAAAGYETGSVHPLQSIGGAGHELKGSFCAVDGSEHSVLMAEQVVESVGGRAVRIPPGGKTAYHCAAVLGANFVTTLVHGATALFDGIDISEEQARAMLVPLLKGTLKHLEGGTPAAVMTGPYARRDLEAVAAHVGALAQHAPEWLATYTTLARQSAEMMGWSVEERAALEGCLRSS